MAIFTGDEKDNTINGGIENDTILGLGGDDLLNGDAGNDSMEGGLGNDKLLGGPGDDALSGGDNNDILKAYGGAFEQGSPREFDKLTGGNGSDLFDLRDATGNPAYLNDDVLNESTSKGFALITDFQPDLNAGKGDKIQLQGDPAEYRLLPVSWGQKFGAENTDSITDVALVYIGKEQDKQDVVAVLQDFNAQAISNSDGFLKNPNAFVFDPNYVHPQPKTPIGNPPTGNPPIGNPPTGNPPTGNPPTGNPPGPGINIITGTPAADTLQGTSGIDLILGLGSKDTLTGGAGNDILVGGASKDTITGGTGTDLYVFNRLGDKGDRIKDFSKQEGDKLVFDLDGFAGLKAGGLKSGQFVKGKAALDKNDRFIYDQKKGKLFYDSDGIGSKKQVEVALFDNKPALSASNILITPSPF